MKPHLVFVHGYLGGSSQWIEQVAVFSQYFHVVTVDLPGFGLNHSMESPETIRGYAEFVLNQLDRKGVEQFHLLGHSMGGMIVQEISRLTEDQIDKLICYGTGPRGNIPGRFETIDQSRERLKINGLKDTAYRIAKTWFIEEEKAKYLENIREVNDQDPQRCEICQMIKTIYRALLTQISTIIK